MPVKSVKSTHKQQSGRVCSAKLVGNTWTNYKLAGTRRQTKLVGIRGEQTKLVGIRGEQIKLVGIRGEQSKLVGKYGQTKLAGACGQTKLAVHKLN